MKKNLINEMPHGHLKIYKFIKVGIDRKIEARQSAQ